MRDFLINPTLSGLLPQNGMDYFLIRHMGGDVFDTGNPLQFWHDLFHEQRQTTHVREIDKSEDEVFDSEVDEAL